MKRENLSELTRVPPETEQVQSPLDLLSSSSIPKSQAIEILTSPGIMLELFRNRLVEIFPPGTKLKKCRPQVLRVRQHERQVVLYEVISFDPSVRHSTSTVFVAKRFADREKGRQEFLAMRTLWEKGFDHQSDLKIPKPISFLEDLNLLVQERAHGTLLRNKLTDHSPDALHAQKAAARWLIKLHAVDAGHETIRLHPDDEISIERWKQGIGRRGPKFLPILERMGSLLMNRLFYFKQIPPSLVHGDFQCDNIFVEEEKATAIDFGRFCKSDPARDTGCMIAQARTISFLENGSFAPALPGLNAFWQEYLAGAPIGENETLSNRTCIFIAIKLLENIDYISSFSPGGGKDVWRSLLEDAERFSKADRLEAFL